MTRGAIAEILTRAMCNKDANFTPPEFQQTFHRHFNRVNTLLGTVYSALTF